MLFKSSDKMFQNCVSFFYGFKAKPAILKNKNEYI